MKPFYVYMLRCGDGSYYTGQTDDLVSRLQQHDSGHVGYTSTRKPVELVWQGEFETREGAIAFEQQIKGWSRVKKEALLAPMLVGDRLYDDSLRTPLAARDDASARLQALAVFALCALAVAALVTQLR
jgi:predicted GIY-YIG superfamily endonuclease